MVRLKALQDGDWLENYKISIPYGAIKSLKNLLLIKTVKKFQFLMVRLKVGTILEIGTNTNISIPYGAIKSN